jgi:hypothetical protein
MPYTIRLRRRVQASPPPGLRSAWDEWQVLDGRRIVSRHDMEHQAQAWIAAQEQPPPA